MKGFPTGKLRSHDMVLRGQTRDGLGVCLRPMTEADWSLLLKWNNDPEVLYYAEGDDVASRSLEEVQELYCVVCEHAFCFIIEVEGQPVGECWLQEMNLDRILSRYPSEDCRRIDLMIGEKDHWGRGIGAETIRLLTEFGFEHEAVDRVFACDVADYNVRSRKAFQRMGYETIAAVEQRPGSKARYCYDLALTREAFGQQRAKSQRPVQRGRNAPPVCHSEARSLRRRISIGEVGGPSRKIALRACPEPFGADALRGSRSEGDDEPGAD